MAEAKLKEISVSASTSGKVQIVKFEYSSGYHFSIGHTYDVEGLTEEEIAKFQDEKVRELQMEAEKHGQKEVDSLMSLRDEIAEGN